MDLMQAVAEGIRIVAGHRIGEIPGELLAAELEVLAFLGGFVAQADDVFEFIEAQFVERLAAQTLGVDAQLLQGSEGARVDCAGCTAGAEGGEVVRVGVPEQRLGQLRAGGIGYADEQHAGLVGHCRLSVDIWLLEYTFYRICRKAGQACARVFARLWFA